MQRLPRALMGLPLFAALLPAALTQAQAAPTAAAPSETTEQGTQASPIETFDLGKALVSETGGLTAEEAAQRARGRSPNIASARAAATSAEWDAKTAWSGYLPQVQLFGQYKRINVIQNNLTFIPPITPQQAMDLGLTPVQIEAIQGLGKIFSASSGPNFTQPPDQWSTGVTVRVPLSDMFLRVMPAYEGQLGVAEARKLQADAIADNVDLQARDAFYAYADALAERLVAEQAVKQAEAQAAQIKLFVDAGTSAPVDYMTATARLEQARAALAGAEGNVAVARGTLSTLTGIPLAEVDAIAEPVMDVPPAPKGTREELINRALEERTELKALRKVVYANDKFHTSQRNAALPQLFVEGSDLYANPNPRYIPPLQKFRNSWEVGASLVWSPNNSVTGYQAGQKTNAELARARADLASFEDAVRIEVVQAFEQYGTADTVARTYEAQLRAAEEAYRVRLAMYRVGAGVIVDLLNADLALTQARLGYVRSTIGARRALARLERVAMLRE